MKSRIYLSSPHMGGKELEYIKEAFDANWISPVGPNISAFEEVLQSYNGIRHAAALSSGTAAIHLALILLGVGRDDEVICSSFTFSGSCNPIAYLGATPVFVDSEEDTWNMDPVILQEAITDRIKKGKKPKAILLVHLYGMPAKVKEIMEVAARYEIPVIEDAAEALGATYDGQKLGTFGVMGVYSFNGNKIITTSGGGALVSNEEKYITRARFLSTQARDPAPHYEHSTIGYNYRMSNIVAGIGRGQMEVLDDHISIRRGVFKKYQEILKSVEGITFVEEGEGMFANRWLTTIFIDPVLSGTDPEFIRQGLEEENIESRPVWKPMHMQPVFQEAPMYGGAVCEKIFEKGLCLPSGSNMDDRTFGRIEKHLKKLFEVTKPAKWV